MTLALLLFTLSFRDFRYLTGFSKISQHSDRHIRAGFYKEKGSLHVQETAFLGGFIQSPNRRQSARYTSPLHPRRFP
jgi:hypothetical protein